jgi:GNAT superfamily N-acetyltransferase
MNRKITSLFEVDTKQLVALGEKFYALSGFPGTFHKETFLSFWEQYLQMGLGSMWVHETDTKIDGAIGMFLNMSIMDGAVVAEEAFWFVNEEARGKVGLSLFDAVEKWATNLGVSRIVMTHLHSVMPEKVATFYERKGFKKLQTDYMKVLK